jgi:hypothetical protein
MKLNVDGLTQKGKLFFLIEETWQGMDATSTYEEQASALRRAVDGVEYVEKAFQQGTVVLAHKESDRASTLQIVAVDNLEHLNEYIKTNEAHARLPPQNRRVVPLSDWESGKQVFLKMIARAEIRAELDKAGKPRPTQDELEALAEERLKNGPPP